ncbi:MAG: nuclear transport factor 2 family protein [Owenweeksia sp.]|nr:nuclear transport factor 2 family protein [Owenweeksia sp.]
MTTKEVANRLVAICRTGEFNKAYDELFAVDAQAIEPPGANAPELVKGLDELRKKSQQFGESLEEVHHIEVSEPLVADNFFSVRLVMDASFKGFGRSKMEELCLYEVRGGKIVKEQFFYTPQMAEA